MHVPWPWATVERWSPYPLLKEPAKCRLGSPQEWPDIQGPDYQGTLRMIKFLESASHTVQVQTTHQSLKCIAEKSITLVYFKCNPVPHIQVTVSVKAIDKLQNLRGLTQ